MMTATTMGRALLAAGLVLALAACVPAGSSGGGGGDEPLPQPRDTDAGAAGAGGEAGAGAEAGGGMAGEAAAGGEAGGEAGAGGAAGVGGDAGAGGGAGAGGEAGAGADAGAGGEAGVGGDAGAGGAPPEPCDDGAERPCPDCPAATQRCFDGAWGDCVGAQETCDGEDNDCDGSIDEQWPELGEPCGFGTGACRGEGVYVCGMMGSRCDARPGRPSAERCDDVDNDCDGDTDEEFDLGAECTVGIGACARDGNIVCDPDGRDSICDAALIDPIIELCDGADNDCDGAIDEGFDVGAPCAAGEGACRNEGEIVCLPDGAAACSVEAGDPGAAELCNALDDDCDGVADEGLAVGEACLIGDGDCQVAGTNTCDGDGGVVCEPGDEDAESCDGADNDCDGAIDEDFDLGEACLAGGGVCQAPGTWACAPDGSRACAPDSPPVLGVGNGADGELVVADGQRVELVARAGAYEYSAVTVRRGGVLTVVAHAADNPQGGQVELRVQGALTVEAGGQIDLSGRGFPGGAATPKVVRAYPGEWTNNGGTTGFHGAGPGGGKGGFAAPQQIVGSGGGGGHTAAGVAGTLCGADARNYSVWDPNVDMAIPIANPGPVYSSGGPAYGDAAAGVVTMGSGGGSGGNNYDGGPGGVGGAGGPGGGALMVVADAIVIEGQITVDGGPGLVGGGGSYLGGGGGGAGGSVYLASNAITVAAGGGVSALGGAGAPGNPNRGVGGAGGVGWIRLDTAALVANGEINPPHLAGDFVCAAPE